MNEIISKEEVESTSEQQLVDFLNERKISVTSIPREQNKKTADYKFSDEFHVENTIFEGYRPVIIEGYFNQKKNNFGEGRLIKLELKNNKIFIKELGKFSCDNNLFLLAVQYTPEVLYPKIINKIDEKYDQISIANRGGLISLDFRVAGIDLYSLYELLKQIMKHEGHSYPKLAGIVLLSQTAPQSPREIPDGVLITNPHYISSLPKEFESLLPPKRIEYEMTPYVIEANLLYSKEGINNFKIKNIPLPDGKTLYITGVSKLPSGLVDISIEKEK